MFLAFLLSSLLHAFALLLPWPAQGGASEIRGAPSTEVGGVSGRLVATGREAVGVEMQRAEPTRRTMDAGGGDSGHGRVQGPAGSAVEYGTYYSSELLTLRPVPLSEVHLEGEFILNNWPAGPAILALWIEADGRVSRVEVETSEYPEQLAEALRTAFGKLKFRPGEVDGRGVPVFLRIEASYGPVGDHQP